MVVKGGVGPLVGKARFGQVDALDQIARIGKGGDHLAGAVIWCFPTGGTPYMVGVEMGLDDNGNIGGLITNPVQVTHQPIRTVHKTKTAALFWAELITIAGIDQD